MILIPSYGPTPSAGKTDLEKRSASSINALNLEDQRTPTNSTVLHLACQYGSINCVHHILNHHGAALLLKTNSRGETALHLAAKQGQLNVVQALVDRATALAQQHNNVPNHPASMMVQNLMRTADEDLETALHGAVRYNRIDVVRFLVERDRSYLHPQNKYKETPLYLASIRYYPQIIATILDNCDWPNISGIAGGKTDLYAMCGGPEGRTALHAAVLDYRNPGGHDKYVAYHKDKMYGRTPLHIAAYTGNVGVMITFVHHFPDCWEITDGSGRNILHIAVEEDRKEVIDYILFRGFKASNNLLTKRDNSGNTPLHLITKLGIAVPRLMRIRVRDRIMGIRGIDPRPLGILMRWLRSKLMDRRRAEWEVDWEVLDSNNYTPLDVLHLEEEKHTLANQLLVRTSLIEANVRKHWWLWRTLREPNAESGKRIVKHTEITNNLEVEEHRKAMNTHMVVSALIATVAFSALFNVPGGFDGSKGSPVLLRKTRFAFFIIFDAIALMLSVASLLRYFVTSSNKDANQVKLIVQTTATSNFLAIVTMMIAFVGGTSAMLADNSILANVVGVLTLFFLIGAIPISVYIGRGGVRSRTLLPTSNSV
nr:PREDICTED: ankyrin repeat-containing protein At3g12360-like isoform X3 [Daucus carota subsp. sativus]